MNEAIRQIEGSNMVLSVAGKFSYAADFDDLVQEGMIALIKAHKHYQPELGEFEPYAYRCILRAARRYARLNFSMVRGGRRDGGSLRRDDHQRRLANEANRRQLSLDTPIGDRLTLEDALRAEVEMPEEAAIRGQEIERMRSAMGVLRANEREVLAMRFNRLELTLEHVAQSRGCRRQNIDQIEKRALGKLRRELAA